MSGERVQVVYWDASALLSALFRDSHSEKALHFARLAGAHLLSTLALAEVQAVAARMAREHIASTESVETARQSLMAGPWRLVHAQPSNIHIAELAVRWSLRGADLWHLALAKTLEKELPEIKILTFDHRLGAAAAGERLAIHDADG